MSSDAKLTAYEEPGSSPGQIMHDTMTVGKVQWWPFYLSRPFKNWCQIKHSILQQGSNFRKTQVNKTILPPQFQKVRIEASTKVHNILEYNIVIYPNVRIGLSTKEPPCPVLYSPIQ